MQVYVDYPPWVPMMSVLESSAVIALGAATAIAFACVLWRRFQYQKWFLDSIAALIGGRLQGVKRSLTHDGAKLSAQLLGRPITFRLEFFEGLWFLRLGVACRGPLFFLLGEMDGPESYEAQLSDPVVRNAVRSLVQNYHVDVAMDVEAADGRERLWLMLGRFRLHSQVPANISAIAQSTVELAQLIESRSQRRSRVSDETLI